MYDSAVFSAAFSSSRIYGIIYKIHVYPSSVSRMFNCPYMKYFLPNTKSTYFFGYTGFLKNDFYINSQLEEIRIYKLRKNGDFSTVPNLSKNSVRYMINTSDATSAITITLHADAYARLANDEDVIADLEAKNAELQGTGGSINLVSA
jgi:hypothetical protein